MAILSFVFEQLFMLLMPELVVFPREPDLVQNCLSILSHFVLGVTVPLTCDPLR
jgi:hypothetical protein